MDAQTPVMESPQGLNEKLLIILVRFYQLIVSPIFKAAGVECKYSVSCSQYSILAIRSFGWKKGSILAIKRFLSCI